MSLKTPHLQALLIRRSLVRIQPGASVRPGEKRCFAACSSRAETLQIIEVAGASSCSLHRDEVVEAADAHANPVEMALDRTGREGRVRRICVDAGNPLHDVEVAQPRLEPEVGAGDEVFRARRIERELLGAEVAETDMAGVELGEQSGEALQIVGIGIGLRPAAPGAMAPG